MGYLNIALVLIRNDSEILTKEQYSKLVQELLERDLFTLYFEPMDSDITKESNILEYEKPRLNKCLTYESRNSAYEVLLEICRIHLDFSVDVVSKFLHPIIQKLRKPKKSGYAPRSEGRSFYGYCGIKNLGCICYMNSMIQ